MLFIPAPKHYEVQIKGYTPGEDKRWEVNMAFSYVTLSTSHTNKWEAEQGQADLWRTSCSILSTAAFAFLPNYLKKKKLVLSKSWIKDRIQMKHFFKEPRYIMNC